MPHELPIRVYYEDTDAAGVVYYANYLKFIERGRSEALIALGIDQVAVLKETGLFFAVRKVEAEYLASGRLQDQLLVTTAVSAMGRSTIDLAQEVRRNGAAIFTAQVKIVCVGPDGRATRVPEDIRERLGELA